MVRMAPRRPARSARNQNPDYTQQREGAHIREPARPKPKKMTLKSYEIIVNFLKNVALKNVRKYGGTGRGNRLWREKLLERLNCQPSYWGELTRFDLNSWLKNKTLEKLVRTLKESTAVAKPNPKLAPGKTARVAKKGRPSEEGNTDAVTPKKRSQAVASVQRRTSKKPRPSDFQGKDNWKREPGSSSERKQQASESKATESQKPRNLTKVRRSVITDFLEKATLDVPDDASRKNASWKANLLKKLNQHPGSRCKDNGVITPTDLQRWLHNENFKKMTRKLERAGPTQQNENPGGKTDNDYVKPTVAKPDRKRKDVPRKRFLPNVQETMTQLRQQIGGLKAVGQKLAYNRDVYYGYVDRYRAMLQTVDDQLEGISNNLERHWIPILETYLEFSKTRRPKKKVTVTDN